MSRGAGRSVKEVLKYGSCEFEAGEGHWYAWTFAYFIGLNSSNSTDTNIGADRESGAETKEERLPAVQ